MYPCCAVTCGNDGLIEMRYRIEVRTDRPVATCAEWTHMKALMYSITCIRIVSVLLLWTPVNTELYAAQSRGSQGRFGWWLEREAGMYLLKYMKGALHFLVVCVLIARRVCTYVRSRDHHRGFCTAPQRWACPSHPTRFCRISAPHSRASWDKVLRVLSPRKPRRSEGGPNVCACVP